MTACGATLRRWTLAALLAALLALSLSARSADAAPRALDTGLSGLYDFGPQALAQTKASGVSFVRVVVSWAAVAPTSPPPGWNPADSAEPAYGWYDLDQALIKATAAGLTPLALVTEAPRWAQRCHHGSSAAVCDPDPAAFAAFARAAADRYSGRHDGLPRVHYWQPINEPNLSLFFLPQWGANGKPVSATLYRDLLNRFAAAVKSVHADNLVVAGGLGPIAVPKATIGPMQFTRELLCMKNGPRPRPQRGNCGGGVSFDIFATHPYTTGGPTHKGGANDVQLGDLRKLQRLLRAAKKAKRINSNGRVPLWITEFSWDTRPPDPGGLPMKIAVRWVSEALFRSWQAGVDKFFWYSLRDDPPNPSYRDSLQSGLYFSGATVAEDRPKPILTAFRFPFVAYPRKRGLQFWGRTPDGAQASVVVQVRKKGKWVNLRRIKSNRFGLFRGTFKGNRYGADKRGSARAVIRGEASRPFSMRPVRDFYHRPFG